MAMLLTSSFIHLNITALFVFKNDNVRLHIRSNIEQLVRFNKQITAQQNDRDLMVSHCKH